LLGVAHVRHVEIVLNQVLDQEAPEAAGHRDIEGNVAVPTDDRLGHVTIARGDGRQPRDERRRLPPVNGEGRHVVLVEPLVLVIADDDGDVGLDSAQSP